MYPYQRSGAAASDSLLKAAGGQPAEKATQKLLDLRPYLTKSEASAFALWAMHPWNEVDWSETCLLW